MTQRHSVEVEMCSLTNGRCRIKCSLWPNAAFAGDICTRGKAHSESKADYNDVQDLCTYSKVTLN